MGLRELGILAARAPSVLYEGVQDDGLGYVSYFLASTYSQLRRQTLGNPGEAIWEQEWDVLLILDACRLDLMEEVADEYDFISEVDRHYSNASKSNQWLRENFSETYRDEITKTAYVTGNPFTAKVDLEVEPAVLEEVWKWAWDDDLSTIPARPLTDRAIQTWRSNDDIERMIVHYMQPHGPFVTAPELGEYGRPADFGEGFGDLWKRVDDDLERDVVWAAYRENLRYVLEDVELLLDSIDADHVAISADHGNAIGEWNAYGHPGHLLLPSIRQVPWIDTAATDSGEYTPDVDDDRGDLDDEAVESRLRSLGYVD